MGPSPLVLYWKIDLRYVATRVKTGSACLYERLLMIRRDLLYQSLVTGQESQGPIFDLLYDIEYEIFH